MATIYRFIVENRQRTDGGGRTPREPTTKGAAKKGKAFSFFGGDRGGVEHNRKMRAINPLLNRATGGWWEKGTRVGRAGIGLSKNIASGGIKGAFTGPALFIIFSFFLQMLMKWQKQEQIKAEKLNSQNFKQLENGIGAIHGEYSISTNIFNGRQTYNQNK